MNLARIGFVDGLNRDKFDFAPGGNERDERLRLDFKTIRFELETRPGVQIHQSESTLRVRQWKPDELGEPPAHPSVHAAPEPGHQLRLAHAVADDEGGTSDCRAIKQRRNVFRRVLAVAIQSQYPGKAQAKGVLPAGPQCRRG